MGWGVPRGGSCPAEGGRAPAGEKRQPEREIWGPANPPGEAPL